MKIKEVYISDFETTTQEDDCRVWAFGLVNIFDPDRISYGTNIESFIEWCENAKKNTLIYFHNLKFDGVFIANYLLKQGYKFARYKSQEKKRGYFTFTISKMGQWFSGQINFINGNVVKFRDSLKKLPFKVSEIAKAFNLNMLKGELDYNKYRSKEHVLTEDEIAYLKNDLLIVQEAILLQYKEGLTKGTIASDSLSDLKDTIGRNVFDNYFPKLTNDLFYWLKHGYKGGQTYVSKKKQGKIIKDGIVLDINSQYPYIMYTKEMPIGNPVFFKGEYKQNKRYPLYVQKLSCDFKLKKDKIPTIQIKQDKRFLATEFLESNDGEPVDLILTNIDLKLFKEHYDLFNIEYKGGFMFQSKTGIFSKYIDKHMSVKSSETGGKRTIAKLKLNSPYGKFGSDPEVTGKYIYMKEDGSLGFRMKDRVYYKDEIDGKDKVKEVPELKEFSESVYLPVAMFVTSYGRDMIVRTAQKVYHRFCYCDTDSIHLEGSEIPVELKDVIDSNKLGYWDHEASFRRAKFIRPKTYVEEIYDDKTGKYELNVKCAGMPDNVREDVTFDNFKVGAIFPNKKDKDGNMRTEEELNKLRKLIPKMVNGGVVLTPVDFSIRGGGMFGF